MLIWTLSKKYPIYYFYASLCVYLFEILPITNKNAARILPFNLKPTKWFCKKSLILRAMASLCELDGSGKENLKKVLTSPLLILLILPNRMISWSPLISFGGQLLNWLKEKLGFKLMTSHCATMSTNTNYNPAEYKCRMQPNTKYKILSEES